MSIIIVGVGQAEFDGESGVPFPALSSHRISWHPVPTSESWGLGGLVCPERVCQYPRMPQPHPGAVPLPRARSLDKGSRALAACWSRSLVSAREPQTGLGLEVKSCGLCHIRASLVPTAMVELDGDDVRISSRGKLAERDIVQVKTGPALHSASNLRPASQTGLRVPLPTPQGQTLESPLSQCPHEAAPHPALHEAPV